MNYDREDYMRRQEMDHDLIRMRTRSTADVVRELNRVKVLFQARTVAAVIGAPDPARALHENPESKA